jgi:predicted ester cyclase
VAAEGVLEGTHKGPLAGPGGQMIPATYKRVRLPFCELTRMENGKIAEELVYFDLVGMLMQLGLMPSP